MADEPMAADTVVLVVVDGRERRAVTAREVEAIHAGKIASFNLYLSLAPRERMLLARLYSPLHIDARSRVVAGGMASGEVERILVQVSK